MSSPENIKEMGLVDSGWQMAESKYEVEKFRNIFNFS